MAFGLIFALGARAQHRVFTRVPPERVSAATLELAETAAWCRTERLFGYRQRILGFVLELDPEHRQARKALGYVRINGEWHQSKSWRAARDRSPASLPEARKRVAETLAPLRRSFFEELTESPQGLRREAARRTIRALLELDPDDAVLRATLGEARFGDRWVLVESARTATRRDALRQSIERARKHTPAATETAVPAEVAEWPITWSGAAEARGVQVVGGVPLEESLALAREVSGLPRTFELAFGDEVRLRDELRIFLWNGPAGREVALDQLGLPPTVRGALSAAGGGWLGNGHTLGEWDADPLRRRDGAVRQVLGTLWMDRYGIDGGHAWAWEGFGLYLAHLQVGSRRTWFYQGGGYQPVADAVSWPAAQAPDADWFAMARELLVAEGGSRLNFLLGRSLNSMRAQDLVCSYVLAAYLLEGWPEATPRILAAVGRGEHAVMVFERELGFPIALLQERVVRWIDEAPGLVREQRERDASDLGDASDAGR